MTPTNGSNLAAAEKERYIREWTDMMLTIWRDKMSLYQVGNSEYKTPTGKTYPRHSSGELKQSLSGRFLRQSASGDIMKITHSFNLYGLYLDAGVFPGKGGVGQNRISNPNRIPKPWREKSWAISRIKLATAMLEITGEDFLFSLQRTLRNITSIRTPRRRP
jgi:hypothetical protein